MFNTIKKQINWGGTNLELETGKIARQATGAVMAKMGNTVVLCTVVASKSPKVGIDFFPLTVNYIEKFYAIGKVPGGFLKRESRPSERETLISRLIDRPIRPLFRDCFLNEVQIICQVLSYDSKHQSDVVAMIGASAALAISGIPFDGPIAISRVGYKDGSYTLNPSCEELAEDGNMLDLMVAGTRDSVLMIESEASELTEEQMLGAVMFGHEQFKPVIDLISELADEAGKEKWEIATPDYSDVYDAISDSCSDDLRSAYQIRTKSERVDAISTIKTKVLADLISEDSDLENNFTESIISKQFKKLEKDIVRAEAIDHDKRIDGRSHNQVRAIECETGLLPNVHGSALFTRGETQALVSTTLGTGQDEQMIDDIEGNRKERFLLHYNFPSYSVGECSPLRPPGRREIGHGKLAFRAMSKLLPSKEDFPYTIRVVSEVTESNGSSSMATVCGASMSLMAAGVSIKQPIAGIAMGLIKEDEKFCVLSDIMGDEDHLGDMDFKVAGTESGITALQMDIKIAGINENIMQVALDQAKDGRLHILKEMSRAISESKEDMHEFAPKIVTIAIDKSKIGEIIGPGGKVIRGICEETGATVDIEDDGTVRVAADNATSLNSALQIIKDIVAVPEIGKVYNGIVTKILSFGAMVKYLGKSEGMVHISEIADHRIESVSDVLNEGDKVSVRVLSVDTRSGKVRLTMKDQKQSDSTEGGSKKDKPRDEAKKEEAGSDKASPVQADSKEPLVSENKDSQDDGKKNVSGRGRRSPAGNNNNTSSGGNKGDSKGRASSSRGDSKRRSTESSSDSEKQPAKKKYRFF